MQKNREILKISRVKDCCSSVMEVLSGTIRQQQINKIFHKRDLGSSFLAQDMAVAMLAETKNWHYHGFSEGESNKFYFCAINYELGLDWAF